MKKIYLIIALFIFTGCSSYTAEQTTADIANIRISNVHELILSDGTRCAVYFSQAITCNWK